MREIEGTWHCVSVVYYYQDYADDMHEDVYRYFELCFLENHTSPTNNYSLVTSMSMLAQSTPIYSC